MGINNFFKKILIRRMLPGMAGGLAVSLGLFFHMHANAAPPVFTCTSPSFSLMNTATDGAGGALPTNTGLVDANWEAGLVPNTTQPTGHNAIPDAATVPGSVSSWGAAPVASNNAWFKPALNGITDAAWVSQSWNTAQTNQNIDFFFRYRFYLSPSVDPATFALSFRFWSDNSVWNVYVNNVAQQGLLPGLPQNATDPYYGQGFQVGQAVNLNLNNSWATGLNELVVQVSSAPTFLGFMARLTGVNCQTLIPSVDSFPDTGIASSGTASTPISSVVANDLVDGVAADLATNATISVVTPASNPGVVLNTATGAVTTTSAVPPGTYVITYRLCNSAAPAVCANTTATVTIADSVSPVADIGTASAGTATTAIANVVSNDIVNGTPAVLGGNANISVVTPASHAGVTLNTATGAVATTSAVPPGVYTITYRLCDLTPTCADTTATVTVAGSAVPSPDIGTASAGVASTPIANVVTNDLVDGVIPVLGVNASISVVTPASNPGVSLNTATGAVTVTAATPPGIYFVTYRLCNMSGVCADTTATVTVNGQAIPGSTASIPTLSQWGIFLLLLLVAAVGCKERGWGRPE